MCLLAVCMTYIGLYLDLVTFHRTKYRSLRPLCQGLIVISSTIYMSENIFFLVRPSGPGRYQAFRQHRFPPAGCGVSPAVGRNPASSSASSGAGASQQNIRTRPPTPLRVRTTPRRERGTARRSVTSVHHQSSDS